MKELNQDHRTSANAITTNRKTMSELVGDMGNHTEALVHLNEILNSIYDKVKGANSDQKSGVNELKSISPNGLINCMDYHDCNIREQLEIAHSITAALDDLL